jgi:hypothetical protein
MTHQINLNVRNPVEFLACCGLLELGWLSNPGESYGWFTNAGFMLDTPTAPKSLLDWLIHGQAVPNYDHDRLKSLAITTPSRTVVLDWFTDTRYKSWGGGDDAYDLWAVQSNHRVSLQRAAQHAWSTITDVGAVLDAAVLSVPATGRTARAKGRPPRHFNLDYRTAPSAGDLGFSPVKVGMDVPVYVYTEMLAAVGLQRFRPPVADQVYSYFAWNRPLAAPVAAVARFCSPGNQYTCTRKSNNKTGKFFTIAEGANDV